MFCTLLKTCLRLIFHILKTDWVWVLEPPPLEPTPLEPTGNLLVTNVSHTSFPLPWQVILGHAEI